MSISEEPDFSRLDDSALISLREEMRGKLKWRSQLFQSLVFVPMPR